MVQAHTKCVTSRVTVQQRPLIEIQRRKSREQMLSASLRQHTDQSTYRPLRKSRRPAPRPQRRAAVVLRVKSGGQYEWNQAAAHVGAELLAARPSSRNLVVPPATKKTAD
eukprot:513262-Pleurochrysis_carterae.AAC.1